MFRWFLGTFGVLLIFGGVFGAGVYVGGLQAGVDAAADKLKAKDEVIVQLQDEVKSTAARAAEDVASAAETLAAQKELATWMKANAGRRIDIGGELTRALDALDLSLCVLSPAVRSVRQRAVEEVRNAGLPDARRPD